VHANFSWIFGNHNTMLALRSVYGLPGLGLYLVGGMEWGFVRV
jgi:hypothetical protein